MVAPDIGSNDTMAAQVQERLVITFQVEFDSGTSAQISMDVHTVQIRYCSLYKKTNEKLEGCDMWNICRTYICCYCHS